MMATLPDVLASSAAGLRFIEDLGDVVTTIREVAAVGRIEADLATRIERDLREAVKSCFATTLH